MSIIAKTGPLFAPTVGACLAITASTVLPLSAALTAGVLLTMAVRQVLGVSTDGTLAGGAVVCLVGLALFVRSLMTVSLGNAELMTRLGAASSARLLLGLAVGGLLVHELLVRADEILEAGSVEAAGRHRYWTAPTTFVALCVAGLHDVGLQGFGRPVAAAAVLGTVSVHTLLVAASAPPWLTALALSLSIVSLFGLSAVADGAKSFDDSGRASVVDGVRRFWS
jgi:hypothetical protein